MKNVILKRRIFSILSLVGNSIFVICDFIKFFIYMLIVALLGFLTGLGGQDYSNFIGMEIGYLIIGLIFIILFIYSLIALFKAKDNSKENISKSIIRTSLFIILYGIYYLYFMPEKHEYILLIVLINFIEMCYNIILLKK